MAERATNTRLVWGGVTAPVSLFKTVGPEEDLPGFDAAGPNGGVLRLEARAEEVAGEEPTDDPLVAAGRAISEAAKNAPPLMRPIEGPFAELTGGPGIPGEYRQCLREEGSGEWVEKADVRRGVRTPDGSFVDLTDQLAAVEEETRLDRMKVYGFVDVGRVDRARVTGSYFVGSGGEGAPKVLRLLYEAIRDERRVAVVKWTKRSRQAEGVVVADARRGVLVLLQVAWASMLREPNEKARSLMLADVSEREVEAARALVRAMGDSVGSLDELEDDAVVLRRGLYQAALDGRVPQEMPEERLAERPEEDLAETLERSVARAAA